LKGTSTNVFFYLNILITLLYLLSLTILVDWTSAMKYDRFFNETEEEKKKEYTINNFLENGTSVEQGVWLWFLLYVFCVFCLFIFTTRELVQLKNAGRRYFRSSENILEVVALVCTWIYVVLSLGSYGYEIEQIFAAIAVFCAWLEMSLMIGRIPSIGIFTFMMFQVVRQVIKFFFVYFTTLVAFAYAFHLLLIRDGQVDSEEGGVFDSIWPSFLKVTLFVQVFSVIIPFSDNDDDDRRI
jgi:hypothetical protein